MIRSLVLLIVACAIGGTDRFECVAILPVIDLVDGAQRRGMPLGHDIQEDLVAPVGGSPMIRKSAG
jgi:hypothetical protein